MIGIYKITNKLCNKSYIGQSIRCGERFNQHCNKSINDDMFIDNVIAVEGIENFSFELLKEADRNELSYWEDYFILKFNTYFPNGYNRKWNCSEEIRNSLKIKVKKDLQEEELKNKPDSILTEEEILYLFNDESFYQYCLIYFLFVYKKEGKYYAKNRDITSKNLTNYSEVKYNTVNKYKNNLKENKLLIKNEQTTEFCYIPDILNYLTKEEILIAGKDTIFLWYIKKKISENNQKVFFSVDFIWALTMNSLGCYHAGDTTTAMKLRIKGLESKGLLKKVDIETYSNKILITL